jgi:hypothetical protein
MVKKGAVRRTKTMAETIREGEKFLDKKGTGSLI